MARRRRETALLRPPGGSRRSQGPWATTPRCGHKGGRRRPGRRSPGLSATTQRRGRTRCRRRCGCRRGPPSTTRRLPRRPWSPSTTTSRRPASRRRTWERSLHLTWRRSRGPRRACRSATTRSSTTCGSSWAPSCWTGGRAALTWCASRPTRPTGSSRAAAARLRASTWWTPASRTCPPSGRSRAWSSARARALRTPAPRCARTGPAPTGRTWPCTSRRPSPSPRSAPGTSAGGRPCTSWSTCSTTA
mmetsp:Transcript_39622/g.123463  ORF Transcript_39622/g.123463 Transcript_39622/m.123463 type:complete len:247 (+) Transcript_39622:403-1143(+)